MPKDTEAANSYVIMAQFAKVKAEFDSRELHYMI